MCVCRETLSRGRSSRSGGGEVERGNNSPRSTSTSSKADADEGEGEQRRYSTLPDDYVNRMNEVKTFCNNFVIVSGRIVKKMGENGTLVVSICKKTLREANDGIRKVVFGDGEEKK